MRTSQKIEIFWLPVSPLRHSSPGFEQFSTGSQKRKLIQSRWQMREPGFDFTGKSSRRWHRKKLAIDRRNPGRSSTGISQAGGIRALGQMEYRRDDLRFNANFEWFAKG
jgi:hypothetical protein